MVFHKKQEALAHDKTLGINDFRVLHLLMARSVEDNWISISQTEIAEILGMHRSHVSTCMKKLCERNVIEKAVKLGNFKMYRFSISYGWNGSKTGYKKESMKRYLRAVK